MVMSKWMRVLVAAIAAGSMGLSIGAARAAVAVSVQLEWRVRGTQAVFFVARDMG